MNPRGSILVAHCPDDTRLAFAIHEEQPFIQQVHAVIAILPPEKLAETEWKIVPDATVQTADWS